MELFTFNLSSVRSTDFWAAYGAVFPSKRHRAVGKETGKTSYIERFNNTLRQRVSRLVRKRRDPASPTGVYPEHRSGQAQLRVLGKGMLAKTNFVFF